MYVTGLPSPQARHRTVPMSPMSSTVSTHWSRPWPSCSQLRRIQQWIRGQYASTLHLPCPHRPLAHFLLHTVQPVDYIPWSRMSGHTYKVARGQKYLRRHLCRAHPSTSCLRHQRHLDRSTVSKSFELCHQNMCRSFWGITNTFRPVLQLCLSGASVNGYGTFHLRLLVANYCKCARLGDDDSRCYYFPDLALDCLCVNLYRLIPSLCRGKTKCIIEPSLSNT